MPREPKTIKELEALIREHVGDIGQYLPKVFARDGGDWIAITVFGMASEHESGNVQRIVDELRQQYSVNPSEPVVRSEPFSA